MIKRKRNAKKALIIISVAVVICILACSIVGGFMIYDFSQKNFVRMPTWYVCKQIEKDVPIGTNADTVIEYLKSKPEWSVTRDFNSKDHILHEGFNGPLIGYNACLYSFNKLNYKKELYDHYYSTSVYLGGFDTTSSSGYYVKAVFIFDESKTLIDIVVYRYYVGF